MRLAVAVFLMASSALASTSIGGRVTTAGKPLAGATVSASTASMPQAFVTRTAGNGAYALPVVPAGTYDVTFALAGYQTLTRRVVARSFESARVDADLEVSEEGESVTQTGGARDLQERPQSAWTLDRETADLLPFARIIAQRAFLGPLRPGFGLRIEDIATDTGFFLPPEGVDDTSLLFAGTSADHARPRAEVTTRGQREFHAAVREAIHWRRYDATHAEEASLGGRWALAAAERTEEYRSVFAKAVLAPTARDTVTLSFLGTTLLTQEEPRGAWLHVGPRASVLAQGARHFSSLRGYAFVAGAHEVSAGFERRFSTDSFYVRDRWRLSDRAAFEGGLRMEEDVLQPRAAFVFGETTRFFASYARYADRSDEAAIGVARRVFSTGSLRAVLIRHDQKTIATLDGSAQWLLLTFGGSASVTPGASVASAWIIVDPPLPGHDLSVSVLGRYLAKATAADIAVNYAWPRERLTPFAEVAVADVFDERAYRAGLGLRWR